MRLLLFLPLFIWSCTGTPSKAPAATEQLSQRPHDDHSYANLEQIHTQHLHLDLEVDFAAQKKKKPIYDRPYGQR